MAVKSPLANMGPISMPDIGLPELEFTAFLDDDVKEYIKQTTGVVAAVRQRPAWGKGRRLVVHGPVETLK